MRRNKKVYLLTAAVSSIGLSAISAKAATTYDFGITVGAGNTYQVYALDTTPTQDAGLAGFEISVDGTGGASATAGSIAPAPAGAGGVGFTTPESNGSVSGANWVNMFTSQNIVANPYPSTSILAGVGQQSGTGPGGASWGYTAGLGTEIASGTYSGTGTLTVIKDETHFAALTGTQGTWSSAGTQGNITTLVFGSVTVGGVTPHPIISLSTTAPASNYGNKIVNATGVGNGTFQNNPSSNKLSVIGGSSSYLFDQVTGISSGQGEATGNVEGTGFNPGTDQEVYALDVLASAGGSALSNANLITLAADINSGNAYGGDAGNEGAVVASTSLAADPFPSNYNLFLTFSSPTQADNFLGVDLTQDPNIPAGAVVSAIAVVPEPMSMGLLALGGLGMLARRRRTA